MGPTTLFLHPKFLNPSFLFSYHSRVKWSPMIQVWVISPPQLVLTKRLTPRPSNQIWQRSSQQIRANVYAFKLESLLSSPWKFIGTFKFNGYWNLVLRHEFGVLFPALLGKGEALLIGAEGKSGARTSGLPSQLQGGWYPSLFRWVLFQEGSKARKCRQFKIPSN